MSELQLRACIDIGTNSIKVLIAELGVNCANPVYEMSAITRLGEGMSRDLRLIRPSPMQRTLDALAQFVNSCREYGLQQIECVGTSALRDAANSDTFLKKAHELCGIDVEVLTGDEEARLSYLAVRRDPSWRGLAQVNVIDVGGGSTELVCGAYGSMETIDHRISVPVGAVKLTERYLQADPPTLEQLQLACKIADEAFSAALGDGSESSDGATVVGVGGTVTTLAAMCTGLPKLGQDLHGKSLSAADLDIWISKLAGMSIDQRNTIPGLDPRRSDIILAGAILLNHAMAAFGCDVIQVSQRGLRWGVLYDRTARA